MFQKMKYYQIEKINLSYTNIMKILESLSLKVLKELYLESNKNFRFIA